MLTSPPASCNYIASLLLISWFHLLTNSLHKGGPGACLSKTIFSWVMALAIRPWPRDDLPKQKRVMLRSKLLDWWNYMKLPEPSHFDCSFLEMQRDPNSIILLTQMFHVSWLTPPWIVSVFSRQQLRHQVPRSPGALEVCRKDDLLVPQMAQEILHETSSTSLLNQSSNELWVRSNGATCWVSRESEAFLLLFPPNQLQLYTSSLVRSYSLVICYCLL